MSDNDSLLLLQANYLHWNFDILLTHTMRCLSRLSKENCLLPIIATASNFLSKHSHDMFTLAPPSTNQLDFWAMPTTSRRSLRKPSDAPALIPECFPTEPPVAPQSTIPISTFTSLSLSLFATHLLHKGRTTADFFVPYSTCSYWIFSPLFLLSFPPFFTFHHASNIMSLFTESCMRTESEKKKVI